MDPQAHKNVAAIAQLAAFTKAKAYDITLSGSLVVTGSVAFSSRSGRASCSSSA